MAWVGIDRILAMADQIGLSKAEKSKYETLREEIRAWIWKHCYDEKTGRVTQHPDTKAQDASAFLFPLLRFLDRHDPRTKDVINAMREELSYEDLYVYRYRVDDGLAGEEGAFILCTFWMIASLAAIGDIPEAERLLGKMRKMMPDSMFIAEEVDPANGEYLGNFPQAFSHIGFVLAAHYIHRYKNRPAGEGNGATPAADPKLAEVREEKKEKRRKTSAHRKSSRKI